jgi:hypothetical protein
MHKTQVRNFEVYTDTQEDTEKSWKSERSKQTGSADRCCNQLQGGFLHHDALSPRRAIPLLSIKPTTNA